MFGHLLIKEWKERWTLAGFAVIVLAGFGIAAQLTADEREAPDILLGAMALVFLPAFGALLGATGFEAEFRNGAWTYLFSRPVRKTKIWSAKFVALFAILVLVGTLSLVVISTSAGLRTSASTLTAPGLGLMNDPEMNMLTLGFGLSFFTFAVAFAMSILTERAITVTAVSLFLGFAVYAGWLLGFIAVNEWWLSDFRPDLVWAALLLTALAALFASLETFRKADFSQPRGKAGFFWRRAGVLLVLVLAIVTVAAIWPEGPDIRLRHVGTESGMAYFSSGKGIYAYRAEEDRLVKLFGLGRGPDWIVRGMMFVTSLRSGRLAGTEWTREGEAQFMIGLDGRDRVYLTGPRAKDSRIADLPVRWGPFLSPDGRAVVFSTYPRRLKSGEETPPELWLVNGQGEVMGHTAVVLPGLPDARWANIWISAWPEGTNLVISSLISGNHEDPNCIIAWDIIQNRLRLLVEDASLPYFALPSPAGRLALRRRSADRRDQILSVLSLQTGALTDIWTELNAITELSQVSYHTEWSPDGQRLAFSARRDGQKNGILGIYSWPERRIVRQREFNKDETLETRLFWVDAGQRLVMQSVKRKGIEILGEDLAPTRFITFPEGRELVAVTAIGEKLLLVEWEKGNLWQLDLKTEHWKRVY